MRSPIVNREQRRTQEMQSKHHHAIRLLSEIENHKSVIRDAKRALQIHGETTEQHKRALADIDRRTAELTELYSAYNQIIDSLGKF